MSKIAAYLLENGSYQEMMNDIAEEESADTQAERAKNPLHYKSILPGYQYMDTMEHILGYNGVVAHLRGQIFKYLMRYGAKDQVLQESKKIAWYSTRLEDVEKRYVEGNFPCKPSSECDSEVTGKVKSNNPDDPLLYEMYTEPFRNPYRPSTEDDASETAGVYHGSSESDSRYMWRDKASGLPLKSGRGGK